MWSKIGINMKIYNDMLTNSTTSTNIDKDTWQLYASRNSRATGIWCPEEDQAPYILPDTVATHNIKKKYL